MSYKQGGQGKGDNARPVNKIVFDDNWIRAFGNKCFTCDGEGTVNKNDEQGNFLEIITCLSCHGIGKVGR